MAFPPAPYRKKPTHFSRQRFCLFLRRLPCLVGASHVQLSSLPSAWLTVLDLCALTGFSASESPIFLRSVMVNRCRGRSCLVIACVCVGPSPFSYRCFRRND